MTSGWAAVLVAAAMMGGTVIAVIWRGGRRDGRVDAVLERLTDLAEDHETRIRGLENPRRREGRHSR